MTEKKQIEEMAKAIYETGMTEGYTHAKIIAGELYRIHGYRKQSVGEWITEGDELKNTTCSACGHWVETPYGKTLYCPNCGAKMKGGAE